jgi:hypothetical protein
MSCVIPERRRAKAIIAYRDAKGRRINCRGSGDNVIGQNRDGKPHRGGNSGDFEKRPCSLLKPAIAAFPHLHLLEETSTLSLI